ncbi:flagellar hook-associated protein FlgL [Piscinibacter sp.]|uniref:flagellar hook-associated protein FlgL n=1 Tax=Piscinibacter sp. TaxID=1903157 RepID=UPI002C982E80|nr:flagellar hook-associated protein FlgL [Albitalea sp.]HUG20908.1 flagellar hook-associated protein FlgL [Albitalea sp.]
MTRISTAQAFDSSIEQLQRRQSDLIETQTQLSSGKRVNRASDDPTAAARAERALASMSRVDATQRGVEASRALMSQTEGALGDAGELMQRARESLVAAGNGTYSDAQRLGIANELRGIREQLLAVANRSDGAQGYLFGGQGSAQAPFLDAPGGAQFRGTSGQALTAGAEPLPLSMDGGATWLQARTGNGTFETRVVASTGSAWINTGTVVDPSAITGSTYNVQFAMNAGVMSYSVLRDGVAVQSDVAYTSGQAIEVDGMAVTITGAPAVGDDFEIIPSTSTLSVFDVLDKAVAELSTGGRPASQVTQSNAENLRNIDQVMSRLQTARSDAGETLNRIDGVTDRLAGLKLQSQTERSSAEDLDMVQAISEFQNKQSGYDAALKSYAMVQRLSLFQYLNG